MQFPVLGRLELRNVGGTLELGSPKQRAVTPEVAGSSLVAPVFEARAL